MTQHQRGEALGASYKISEQIGSGAAGEVWAVEPTSGGATLAAKILKSEHASDPAIVERFVRERSVLMGLTHENIVRVRDFVVEGSTLAIVMDFVPGGSLRELLEREGTLAAHNALDLSSQVLQALAAAHAQRITHRDIKPDNVLLSEPWQPGNRATVRVTDFGIASVVHERNRQTTGLLGTPKYMAPELISHGQTTPAADVYAAGILLYELLAGRTPFDGSGTDFTVAYRHVTSNPPKLDLPAPLWSMLTTLLSKDPRQRPAAATAASELAQLADRFNDLAPLDVAPATEEFEEIERPATVLRGDLVPETMAPEAHVSDVPFERPELGDATQQTMLRPMPRRDPLLIPTNDDRDAGAAGRTWLTKKTVLLGVTGLLLLAGLGAGIASAFGGGTAEADVVSADPVQASQQDQVLPTGLGVSRTALFTPESDEISLEITYSAQKAPLTGEFFQSVPAAQAQDPCPSVIWEGATATQHQPSATGLTAECGWKLTGINVPPNGRVTVTGTIKGTVEDAAALTEWLTTTSSLTSETLTDAERTSTAYPAQRIQNVQVKVPSRTVSQAPLGVTLLPVWPSGPDEINPLFKSPATGSPSSMLQAISDEATPVRFADGCSGATSVARDGVTVTALTVVSDCRLRASVGNFTSLESNPFSITTRG